jgi:hypothetical protein
MNFRQWDEILLYIKNPRQLLLIEFILTKNTIYDYNILVSVIWVLACHGDLRIPNV